MAQASDFGGACLKLEEIANLADKIHNQYGNGEVSFARSLLLPGEIEKLCKAMGKVGVEEFRGLDVAAERKGVVSAKWLTVSSLFVDSTSGSKVAFANKSGFRK